MRVSVHSLRGFRTDAQADRSGRTRPTTPKPHSTDKGGWVEPRPGSADLSLKEGSKEGRERERE